MIAAHAEAPRVSVLVPARGATTGATTGANGTSPRSAMALGARLMVLGPLVAIAGGRWGSYVGVAGLQVFLADALVVAGLALLLLDLARHGSVAGIPRSPLVVRVASALVVIALLVGLTRAEGSPLTVARDALPFVYLALAPVFLRAAWVVGADRLVRWLTWAAGFHTLWFSAVVFGALKPIAVPLAGIPVFTTRGDFDGLVCGIAIATMVAQPRIPAVMRIGVSALSAAAVLAHGSRAGLVAAVLVVAVTVLASRPFRDERRGPVRLAAIFLALPVMGAGLVVAAGASVGWARGLERLLAGPAVEGTSNTTSARVDAWEAILRHVGADPWSRWLGDGFGSDFVAASGALRHLSGDASVRQAHSFVVGWIALLGLAGAALAFAALAALLIRSLSRLRTGRAARLGGAIQAGTLFAAAVGVILESPFGYMTAVLAVALAFVGAGRPAAPPGDATAAHTPRSAVAHDA